MTNTLDFNNVSSKKISLWWYLLFFLGLCLVFLGLCLVLLIVMLRFLNLPAGPLRISPETTYIIEPLKSNGKEVDYFAAIEQQYYPPDMKTDDNGFRIFVRALGAEVFFRETNYFLDEHIEQFYEKLGLTPPEETLPQLQDPTDFLKKYAQANQLKLKSLQEKLNRPWTFDDLPMMESWLEEAEPVLDLLTECVRKKSFCIPLTRTSEDEDLLAMILEPVSVIRGYGRALSARALHRVAMGNLDGAIDDRITCAHLGRHLEQLPLMVPYLIGSALHGLSETIPLCHLSDVVPTEAQIRRLQKELAELPPHTPAMKTLEMERFLGLDAIYSFSKNRRYADKNLSEIRRHKGVDWNEVMKRYNAAYDRMLENDETEEPFSFDLQTLGKLITRQGRSEMVAIIVTKLFLPALGVARNVEKRTYCLDNIRSIVLAMLLYREQHGMFPPAFSVDSEDKPLQSWRVLILPQLGQQELYDRIRLDEPWDSEYNRQFHAADIPFYQCPGMIPSLQEGETSYIMVADQNPDDPDAILVSECTESICWMNPSQAILSKDQLCSNHNLVVNIGKRNGASESLHISELPSETAHISEE